MTTYMTPDRRLGTTTLEIILAMAPHYVRATDGTYVPRCDLAQYERGDRPAR